MTKLFGTDGIRGIANRELTPELALKIGRAGALVLQDVFQPGPVLIGRDPRLSGDMLEGALVAGITSTGSDVILVGEVPTPAVAFLTRKLGCIGGMMISASHNALQDNGIKIFGQDGFKFGESQEEQVEQLIPGDSLPRPIAAKIGRVYTRAEAIQLYLEDLKGQFPLNLQGLKIVLDCAHGSTSAYAPRLFRDLGAEVDAFFHTPNGLNINDHCGSTFPEEIQALTKGIGADVGFAFDGDGDRLLAVDEKGGLIDGDHILAIVGLHLLSNKQLPAKKVVATPYSNGGLRQVFLASGGDVIYSAVGDRNVLQTMREEGSVLGGEQSGHILLLNNSTTGDGILTALKLLQVYLAEGRPFSALRQSMPLFPQRTINVPVWKKNGWEKNKGIQEAILAARARLGTAGRLYIRASGTEPIIRVLVEHPDQKVLDAVLEQVTKVIIAQLGMGAHAN